MYDYFKRVILACFAVLIVANISFAQSPFDAAFSEESVEAEREIGWLRADLGSVEGQVMTVTASRVNVRSGPGTNFEVLQRATQGDRFVFVKEQSGWYAFNIGDVDPAVMPQAWIRGDMVARIGSVVSVIRDRVNLRGGPSTSYPVVDTTMVGKTFPVTDAKNGWYRIALICGEQYIPVTSQRQVDIARHNFMISYRLYTDLVQKKGINHEQTRQALDQFRQRYGVYSLVAKGSEQLRRIRENELQVDKIVINKSNFTSTLYADGQVVRVYPIAYGGNPDGLNKQRVGDRRTPEGAFEILNKAINPAYQNIPGGAENNPFGTRWMGLNTWNGSIGMHGTSAPASIGSRASAGCIRMFTPDAEELFDLVRVGLPVIINPVSVDPPLKDIDTRLDSELDADVDQDSDSYVDAEDSLLQDNYEDSEVIRSHELDYDEQPQESDNVSDSYSEQTNVPQDTNQETQKDSGGFFASIRNFFSRIFRR